MSEIYIKNSKLKLKRLNFDARDSKIYIDPEDKKSYRYQEIYFMNLGGETLKGMSIYGLKGLIKLDSSSYSGFNEAWTIVNGSEKYKDDEYQDDEKKIIRFVTSGLIRSGRIKVAETLLQALGDMKLQKLFYEAYGEKLKEFAIGILHYDSAKISGDSILEKYLPIYQGTRRYGVYDLINDIVRDGSEVLTDSELIGKYLKISRGIKTGDQFIYDKWSRVIGRLGNKNRANMSITFKGKVRVEIPKNEYDIEAGPREFPAFRSMCIIKDGTLWTPKLGVRINSKSLVGKLRSLGVIEGTVLYDNEYILNLTSLPIVNKNYTRSLTSSSIFYPELSSRLYRIGIAYLKKKIFLKSVPDYKFTELDLVGEEEIITRKEEFLRSLGIYGDDYYPPKPSVKDSEYAYESICIERKILGLPESYYGNVVDYINKGKCKNRVINNFLMKIDKEIGKGKSLEVLKDKYTDLLKEVDNRIIDNNFRLIMGKTLKLREKHCPTIKSGWTCDLITCGETIHGKFKVSLKRILV